MATQSQHTTRRTRETEPQGMNDILRETLQEFRERSDDTRAIIKDYVQQKPMKSLGIAMLTGVALALLIKR